MWYVSGIRIKKLKPLMAVEVCCAEVLVVVAWRPLAAAVVAEVGLRWIESWVIG